MSCVQAFTAALGFAMSAGWDWLPSMHTLWLRDYIEAVSMPTPFGFFGTLSGSIFFKMIMLLALCPVMERLFHAFPLDRVAFRRKPFPNADYALLPPALRERIYLSTPLILSQLCAILLLLVLTFSLPPCLDGLMPWLLGTVSALFGLIWFVLVTLLPGVWSGISYGLAITFSILISLLLDTAPAESLARFRMLFPILAIPLIFFAMPCKFQLRKFLFDSGGNPGTDDFQCHFYTFFTPRPQIFAKSLQPELYPSRPKDVCSPFCLIRS